MAIGVMELKITTLFAIEGAKTSLLGLYVAIFMLIVLIIREKVIESSGIRHSHSGQNISASSLPRARFMQHRRTSTVPFFTIMKMAAGGALVAAVISVYFVLTA